MNLELDNKVVVITGGSSGIGAAMVKAFAAEGCQVHFCGRSIEKIQQTSAQCAASHSKVHGVQLDVTNAEMLAQWLDAIAQFDILVPNVSALSGDWQTALTTDLNTTLSLTELALPKLADSKAAAITFIGSKAASLAAPQASAYGAVKAALAHYMKSLATRLAPRIRVNVLSPGDTWSEGGLWDKLSQTDSSSFQKVVARNPLGRLATAEEIARVAVFLSSPAASFVSGANWYVDGNSCAQVQF